MKYVLSVYFAFLSLPHIFECLIFTYRLIENDIFIASLGDSLTASSRAAAIKLMMYLLRLLTRVLRQDMTQISYTLV